MSKSSNFSRMLLFSLSAPVHKHGCCVSMVTFKAYEQSNVALCSNLVDVYDSAHLAQAYPSIQIAH